MSSVIEAEYPSINPPRRSGLAELAECYNARMDAEAYEKKSLRRFNWTFNHKCANIRRQKNDAEEALDRASERWRAERRKAEVRG